MAEEDVQENLPQRRTAMNRCVRVSRHETIGQLALHLYISKEQKSVGILEVVKKHKN